MDPIPISTANSIYQAFQAYKDGDPGEFTVTVKNTRYTLISEQNQLRNGPMVTFKLEQKVDNVWTTYMQFPDVVGVYATDALYIYSGAGSVRVAYELPATPSEDYVVPPIPPQPFPKDQCNCECTTQRFEDETP